MVLVTKALLARTPQPSEAQVREALGGVFCRCTGYKKPVEAVLAAATARASRAAAPPATAAKPRAAARKGARR
jgi:aerobic-type carbon monoxide dehydrogenase small subunit (CoxS/CutS family)